MNFKDRGIILSKKSLKEKDYIITVFTEKHGLYSGLLKQFSKKNGDGLIEGSLVDFMWSARLHEHLGSVKCELIKSYGSYILSSKANLYAFNSIVSIINKAFGEREPHNNFFPIFLNYIENIKNGFSFTDYINIELAVLAESGYQLILDKCASNGTQHDLFFISPKSGQAVSKAAGMPYQDKLLVMPEFLRSNCQIDEKQKSEAIKLTSYFLNRYIFQNAAQPAARVKFIEYIL